MSANNSYKSVIIFYLIEIGCDVDEVEDVISNSKLLIDVQNAVSNWKKSILNTIKC